MIRLAVLLAALALPAQAAASTLATYSRVGGIAGESTSLAVQRDRHAERSTNRGDDHSWRLSKKRYGGLRAALRAAHFATLAPHYDPAYVVNDGFTETVRFRGHAVSVSTGGEPPRRLERALDKLRALT
jgi:hypothetical protein